MVQDIYEQYCIPGTKPPPIATMEAIAFTKPLASHIRTFEGGVIGFHLFADYELDPKMPTGYVIHPEDGSSKCLRLAYLQANSQ
ncbi:hypothetical protein J3R83DRAFT_10280 [Lanmaoa asiatica]|nr:hypothetical protein J3R83DRAFT_10280 [Lanmaoa asiatica]